MIPILYKDVLRETIDESLNNDNKMTGALVAQVAASYQLAKVKWNATNSTELFVYSDNGIFSSTSGVQKVTDSKGRCRCDCSTFVGLCLRGITFDKSPFKSRAGTPNATWNPDDDWNFSRSKLNICGNYGWEFTNLDNFPSDKYSNIGIQNKSSLRFAADEAKYFFENGHVVYDVDVDAPLTWNGSYVSYGGDNLYNLLQPGDLIFWAKESASAIQKNRWRGISHVAIVAEQTSRFYHCSHASDVADDDSDDSTYVGGVLYATFDESFIDEIELIVRPLYRKNAKNRYPNGINLLNYPPRWSPNYSSSYEGVTAYVESDKTFKLSGTSPDGNNSTRIMRGEGYPLKLLKGTYTASMKKISGDVSRNGTAKYSGTGFALQIKKVTEVNLSTQKARMFVLILVMIQLSPSRKTPMLMSIFTQAKANLCSLTL